MQNFTVLFFGFVSGFLLLLTGNTLNFWISSEGSSADIVSIFSLVTLPYAFNFVWAPLIDSIKFKFSKTRISSRVALIIILHLLGSCIVFTLSNQNPTENIVRFGILALILAAINSTQDIALNAIRTEIVEIKDQPKTSGIYIFGYRLGMILSGSAAIYASDYISMNNVYEIFAYIYLVFPAIIILLFKFGNIKTNSESENSEISKAKLSEIFKYFSGINNLVLFLLFLALYRIADNFISVMLNPFLLSSGYTASQIAISGKFCGILGSAMGGILASYYMPKIGLIKSLMSFAIIHAASHMSYIIINFNNSSSTLLAATIFESITGGMTMAAYIALISSMCHGKFRATQYAIFSAMMGVSRSILPSFAGFVVINSNWIFFFIFSVMLVIPSLFILKKLENIIISRVSYGSDNNS
jgi:MFS transporter, PAT family, beta-lactamase induction signal transducer AmpG